MSLFIINFLNISHLRTKFLNSYLISILQSYVEVNVLLLGQYNKFSIFEFFENFFDYFKVKDFHFLLISQVVAHIFLAGRLSCEQSCNSCCDSKFMCQLHKCPDGWRSKGLGCTQNSSGINFHEWVDFRQVQVVAFLGMSWRISIAVAVHRTKRCFVVFFEIDRNSVV